MEPEYQTKKVGYTKIFEKIMASKARTLINVGGAGSSKSHSIAQTHVVKLFNEENKQFIVARKTMPALRRSSYGLILDLLHEYDLYKYVNHNKSEETITLPSKNNKMWFFGLDDPSKAKSIAGGASYVWLEEADEFTYDDYLAFKLQVRRPVKAGERNQIYLSFNPIDGNGWIPTVLMKEGNEEDIEIIHSTIDDNPFADPEYVRNLKQLALEDENYYRIYVLGEWGRLENLIYQNYDFVSDLPEKWDAWCYGLDFAYTNPTSLVKVVMSDQQLYWHECIYETKLTNSNLIEKLSHFERGDIYADWAEPQRIAELRNAGYSVIEANKDVKLGIDVCKRQPIHITDGSVNIKREVRGYHRKKDSNGNVLDEPHKVADHAMDAGRYGTMGLTSRFGFATARPRPTEPISSLHFKGGLRDKILDRWMKKNGG